MRAYPRYRDSGVEWLGGVPEHWEVSPLKRWFTIVNGGTPASKEDTYWDGETVWLTPDDLGQNVGAWISDGRRRITEDGVRNSSARVNPAGSLVLSTRAPIGHLAITAVPAATNQGCRTLVPDPGTDSSFAYYVLLASRPVLQSLGKGSTFMELTPTDLGNVPTPLLPLDEQQAIAAFLDRETERIDALVAKKRLLIERLQEYRTALITRTVTRGLPPAAARAAGLDPAPRLKPSGVEWLRKVPEHWKVKRLKQIANVRYGLAEPPPEDPEGPSIIRATNVKSGTIDSQGLLHVDAEAIPNGRRAFLVTGEILVVRSGAYTGDSSIVPPEYEGSVAGYDIVVRVLEGFPKYVAWQLLSPTVLKAQFHLRSMRAAQQHLNAEDIGETWIACPPAAEQRAIAACLDQWTGRIDGLTSQVETAIERLQEYRTALITAAVTGKIDVRGSAREQLAAT